MNKSTKDRFKTALVQKFSGAKHAQRADYTKCPEDNLVPGVNMDVLKEFFERGRGGELNFGENGELPKFCAICSSSALAANTFGWFKDKPGVIQKLAFPVMIGLPDFGTFKDARLEERLAIFRGGTPPHLDAWLEGDSGILAVESKLLEPLYQSAIDFSDAYERLKPPVSHEIWWNAYQAARCSTGNGRLDVGQLIKHGFGIQKYLSGTQMRVVLLYVYLEPENWADFPEFVEHHDAIDRFKASVAALDSDASARFQFRAVSYSDIWNHWMTIPELEGHARNLRNRYLVTL